MKDDGLWKKIKLDRKKKLNKNAGNEILNILKHKLLMQNSSRKKHR